MPRDVQFSSNALEDFLQWPLIDKKAYAKLLSLIKECQRGDGLGTGQAEQLKGNLSGWSSKHIDKKNRLVYRLEDDTVFILSCKDHY